MLLMRLMVTNSSTFPALTAALGHYSNAPTRIKWMQRWLQRLFATEHLAFSNSIQGPSGAFPRRCTWGTTLPPPTATLYLRRDRDPPHFFFFNEEIEIQVREHHEENKGTDMTMMITTIILTVVILARFLGAASQGSGLPALG